MRAVTIIGSAVVTLVAAIASFSHTFDVAIAAGQPEYLAVLLPLSVDGLAVAGAASLITGVGSRWAAVLAVALGIVASLGANILAAPDDTLSRVVSAWPSVALAIAAELMLRAPSRRTAPVTVSPAPVALGADVTPAVSPATPDRDKATHDTATPDRDKATPARRDHVTRLRSDGLSIAEIARTVGCSPRTVQRDLAASAA